MNPTNIAANMNIAIYRSNNEKMPIIISTKIPKPIAYGNVYIKAMNA
jgi:hypothetical protein